MCIRACVCTRLLMGTSGNQCCIVQLVQFSHRKACLTHTQTNRCWHRENLPAFHAEFNPIAAIHTQLRLQWNGQWNCAEKFARYRDHNFACKKWHQRLNAHMQFISFLFFFHILLMLFCCDVCIFIVFIRAYVYNSVALRYFARTTTTTNKYLNCHKNKHTTCSCTSRITVYDTADRLQLIDKINLL